MEEIPDSNAETPPQRPRRRRRGGWGLRITPLGVMLLLVIDLLVLGLIAWPLVRVRFVASIPSTPTPTVELVASPTFTLTPTETPQPITPTPTLTLTPPPPPVLPYPSPVQVEAAGTIILALDEGGNSHLFAYEPQLLPLTRLTTGPWDDITPSLSPDGRKVAFASNRNGYWDIYLLDLSSGAVSRLTDSLEYDGAPTWSPDGIWIAHETYSPDGGGNLEIFIRAVAGDQTPIRLTEHPAADYAPVWSPMGRQIAFVSTRSGEPEIWLADLDKVGDERFQNISRNSGALESHPVWSPDGTLLAWSAVESGFHNLYIWDSRKTAGDTNNPRFLGSGDWPIWSPDARTMLSALLAPNETYLVAYSLEAHGLVMPPMKIPGSIHGMTWGKTSLIIPLPAAVQSAAQISPTPLWLPVLTPSTSMPGGRQQVVSLEDVKAPYPLMHDMVDESFQNLRTLVAYQIGWDFLSTLENAFIPLTTSLDPGKGEDWLYTGRAFAVVTLPLNAGWMAVVRQDFGLQTYWRVYLRPRYQDGSAGIPLHDQPWDFNARYSGDTYAYEQGGRLTQVISPGYWLDFTELALDYGWERQPALVTWQYAFTQARFNEFALTDGLDWRTAMLELYPQDVLVTPTIVVPPTRTPSPTPFWYETPTPTITLTPRPTLTPISPTPPPTSTDTPFPTPTSPGTPTVTPTATSTPIPGSPAVTGTPTPQP